MHRLLQGLPLDDNAFAMDAFREVGPGKHFFGAAHTLANYRTAYFEPDLADSTSFEQWQVAGAKDALARAGELWRSRLAGYHAPPLDPAVDEALCAFVAKQQEALPDLWH
jgi:trimethylamine--corrinoid protein Co-methyltransferase